MRCFVAVNSDWCIDFESSDADKRRFKWLTLGFPVVMGRRTWDALPNSVRPLPYRHNFVVTNKIFPEVWETVQPPRWGTWAQYLREWTNNGSPSDVCVIGGGELYHHAMPKVQMLFLSYFPRKKGGSIKFPESYAHYFQGNTWENLSVDTLEAGTEDECHFAIFRRR